MKNLYHSLLLLIAGSIQKQLASQIRYLKIENQILYLLVFLHVETRRAFIAPSTFHPNEAWVQEQAQSFLKHVEQTGLGAKIVMHDRDAKFTASFDESLESADLDVIKTAYRSPNTVAFVERFIQTLQQECLDYFVVFGERHMDHLVSEMLAYYHEERPHQAPAFACCGDVVSLRRNATTSPAAQSRRARFSRRRGGRWL